MYNNPTVIRTFFIPHLPDNLNTISKTITPAEPAVNIKGSTRKSRANG